MKIKLQTLLRHKLQWLITLVVLFGISQGAWAYDYPANTDVYVKSSTYYSTVKLYAWYNDGSDHAVSDGWCGSVMTYLGKAGSYYYWKIQFNHYFSKMIVCDGSCNKKSGDADGEVSSSLAAKNCITITGSSYSWGVFDMCNQFSTPAAVLDGTNVMLYFRGYTWADSKTGITNGDNSTLIGTSTRIGSTNDGYVTVVSNNVPSKIAVTNNAGSWNGDVVSSSGQTSANAAGAFYIGAGTNTKTNATTLSTFSASSTSITEGTSSITLTVKGSSANSSYGDPLWAIIYIDSTKDGCVSVKTTNQSYTLGTSSLEPGSYTIKAVLTDGRIYYLSSSTITLTVTSNCTYPSAPTTITASASPICAGSPSTITTGTATGGYTYKLYDGSAYVGDPIELATDNTLDFGSVTPATTTTYTVYAIETGSGCEYTRVGSASATVTVNAVPTITLTGVGGKSASTTYPWDYMTITATTTPADLVVNWTKLYSGSGSEPVNSVTKSASPSHTYKIKSAITSNPNSDKYTIKANGTSSGCAAIEAVYDVYINNPDGEICD